MPTTPSSLDTIFSEAVEIADSDARAAYLERACGSDSALRKRAESLIAAHLNAGSFLNCTLTEANAASPDTSTGIHPGAMIGPFKLLEKIGEGAMGEVYVADQTQPVKRRVALKLIKPGMDSKEVIGRFEAERQALAMMDHPNIARVLDAGTADTGRPYFVMELVRGLPVTEYCDQAKLPTARRLALFVHICRALQHAHQKGVIHRDIKPSNVLVTLHDGQPVPKVIDFGIAKALNQRLTDQTVYTRLAQLVGTPLYMSPEQAELSGLDIDTRSDVYSLGVLLYELLTSTTPFDPETFQKVGFDEMRRMIREDEPPQPSHRVSTLNAEARSTVSARRGVDERQLRRVLRGDLDWIVMKSLDKDRNRRYESAGAFAADIDRYLADEPVHARPPSVVYRARKFVRRNRAALATAAVVLTTAMVATGAIGWTVFARSADRIQAGQRASEFLAEADRFEQEGRWPDAYGMVERAEAVLGKSGGSSMERECVRGRKRNLTFVLRLEEIRLEVNAVRSGRFDHQLADEKYTIEFQKYGIDVDGLSTEEAVRIMPAAPIRGEVVAALDFWIQNRKRLNSDWKRLMAVAQAADPDSIRSEIREAWTQNDLPRLKRLATEVDIDLLHPNTVELLQQLLPVEEAIPLLRKAQRRRPGDFWLNSNLGRRYTETKPTQPLIAIAYLRAAVAIRPKSPGALNNLGIQLTVIKEYDEAIDVYRAALRLNSDYGEVYNNLGTCLKATGAIDEAISAYREAIRLRRDFALAYSNLGSALYSQRRYSEAVIPLRVAVRLDGNNAIAHANLGNVLRYTGLIDESIEMFHSALRLDPNLAMAHNGVGGIQCDIKRNYDEAIAAFRRALEISPDNHMYLRNLGKALAGKGEYDSAEAAFRESARRRPSDPQAIISLADMLVEKRSWDKAIAVTQEVQRLHPESAAGYYLLGDALEGKGNLDGAIAAYRKALQLKPDDPGILRRFSSLQIDNGDLDGALATLDKLVLLHPNNYAAQSSLFTCHMKKKSWVDAAATARVLIHLKPNQAEGHCNLGLALMRQGLFPEALPALRKGDELGAIQPGWKYPSAAWVKKCEEAAAAAEKKR